MFRQAVSIVAAACAAVTYADTPPAAQRNFVTCPIVRDTATVPCWLAEHDGTLYYLGIQTDISADFDPPFLGHRVLVEGTVAAGAPEICGGVVLEPVRVSPLAEFDATCNTIMPAEDRYAVPFAPRPPGPSGGRLAFDPPAPLPAPAAPAPPFRERVFELHYDFDMPIMGRHSALLGQIYEYAEAIAARRITVTGYSGATLLSDGTTMAEDPALALKRAREVATLLEAAGLAVQTIRIDAGTAEAPDGIEDWTSRRAVVVVSP